MASKEQGVCLFSHLVWKVWCRQAKSSWEFCVTSIISHAELKPLSRAKYWAYFTSKVKLWAYFSLYCFRSSPLRVMAAAYWLNGFLKSVIHLFNLKASDTCFNQKFEVTHVELCVLTAQMCSPTLLFIQVIQISNIILCHL